MTQRVDFSSPSSVMAALSTRDAEIERLRAALREILHEANHSVRAGLIPTLADMCEKALNEQVTRPADPQKGV
jgi:2-oxo-4-hydroxy-4-carboxy--5-ureidoimidazoline (OHCU) decarboxylase